MMDTILVVDDSPVIQRVIAFTLRQSGYRVVTAANGLDALTQMQNQPIALVITDIDMPQLNGLELLRHIRLQQAHAHLPIIMLTASGYEDDLSQAEIAGASGFLTKPASSQDLLMTVREFLVTN